MKSARNYSINKPKARFGAPPLHRPLGAVVQRGIALSWKDGRVDVAELWYNIKFSRGDAISAEHVVNHFITIHGNI